MEIFRLLVSQFDAARCIGRIVIFDDHFYRFFIAFGELLYGERNCTEIEFIPGISEIIVPEFEEEHLERIFDRFYRTDSSRNSSKGGSGIGLSIVKKILEDHGGKVWATSKEGVGTTMYFVLRKYQEVPVS